MLKFNLLQFLLFMNPQIGMQCDLVTPHCSVVDSKSQLVSFNRVCHTAVPTEHEIKAVKAFFGATMFTWLVAADDKATMKVLEENHLESKGVFPAMVLNLNTLLTCELSPEILIESIDIEQPIFETWLSVVSQAFSGQAGNNISAIELNKALQNCHHKIGNRLKLYIGYYQGEAVTAGMLIQHVKHVTLHLIGTLPAFRKQGFGKNITYQMLVDAKIQGFELALLLSSQLGKSVYKKLGFIEKNSYHMYVPTSSK